MIRLSFGVLLKVLYEASAPAVTYRNLCNGLFSIFGEDVLSRDRSLVGHLKNGTNNIPTDVIRKARDMKPELIITNVNCYLWPLLDRNKTTALYKALREIIVNDPTIQEEDAVGFDDSYLKKNIAKKKEVYFEEFIGGVIWYTFTQVRNKEAGNTSKEIPEDYLEQVNQTKEEIIFTNDKTNKNENSKQSYLNFFDEIYLPNTALLQTPSNLHVKVFMPHAINGELRYKCAKRLITDYLAEYSLQKKEFMMLGNGVGDAGLYFEAFARFQNYCEHFEDEALGSIITCMLIERVLNAPKVADCVQMWYHHDQRFDGADCIHILPIIRGRGLESQIVFGISEIEDEIIKAVERSINRMSKLSQCRDFMMENACDLAVQLNVSGGESETLDKTIKGIASNINEPSMAFGVLIGYTHCFTSRGDSDMWRREVQEEIRLEAGQIAESFSQKIRDNNLEAYPIYLYILPFNNAGTERKELLKKLLGKGK